MTEKQNPVDATVKHIRRKMRKMYPAEEKIRII